MTSGTLDTLDREFRELADKDAAARAQAVAALLEKVRQPFEVWEKNLFTNVLAVTAGAVFVGMGIAMLIGAVTVEETYLPWVCLGLGVLALLRGLAALTQRGPLLRFTEHALESKACDPIPWDDILDYEVQERYQSVLLFLELKPDRTPRRRGMPPIMLFLRRRGRFVIEADCLRDWTWESVIERMEEYRMAARLRREENTPVQGS